MRPLGAEGGSIESAGAEQSVHQLIASHAVELVADQPCRAVGECGSESPDRLVVGTTFDPYDVARGLRPGSSRASGMRCISFESADAVCTT